PTLHRLGMQAFEPLLIDGKAIQLHPLVCAAFNADFDGDQMAVHVPLSVEAQIEARVLMMSTNNILSPATGRPIIGPTQDIVLGCYYMTRLRPGVQGEGSRFASPEEARIAFDAGVVHIHAAIKVRIDGEMVETTVGRVLMHEIIPEGVAFEHINKVMDKKALGELMDVVFRGEGNKATVILADRLRTLGYTHATRAGISICIDDMRVPAEKQAIIDGATAEVAEISEQYQDGLITDGERYNKVIDIWAQATEKITGMLLDGISHETHIDADGQEAEAPSFNAIYMMADSGARGSAQQMRQLAGMRGLMAKPSGAIIETPITSNFREGLSVLQYFISTHGARKGLADTALKTANSGYLTRRLVDVSQDVIVRELNCDTNDGLEITALIEAGDIVEPLSERILGRVPVEDVIDPVDGKVLHRAGEEIDEEQVQVIERAGVESVLIRSVLTCETRHGVCANCYGRDLSRGTMVHLGESVGVIAAQSIGEPGTQLTMRTFHIGGTATRRAEQSHAEAATSGDIVIHNVRSVVDGNGNNVAMTRNGEIGIVDSSGRERERHPVVYGAVVKVGEGQAVKAGDILLEWDPFASPILSEQAGTVKFGDIVEGATMQEQVDDFTGVSSKVITEAKDPDLRPRVSVKGMDGETVSRALLPVGAYLSVGEGDAIGAGDVVAKIPREASKTKDITGGLPRVAELFEARKPKECAVVSEIDGIVSFGPDSRGRRRVLVTPDEGGEPDEYLIPKGKHVSLHEGDRVRAGDALMDGSSNPHDILKIKGEKALAKYLVDEVQEVYRLQGVRINDKHIEVIVRQMTRKVRVTDVGESDFLLGEQVEKARFQAVNEALDSEGLACAVGEPQLLGITKASLSTESFISAASFQETTKVLTEAAIWGKVDNLRGLKENVIMGRLIPAGTGLIDYQKTGITIDPPEGVEIPGLDDVAEEEGEAPLFGEIGGAAEPPGPDGLLAAPGDAVDPIKT
ncbi:MAG: DNA-directed RNA polymerase subunit beta', partial [bacterium]|nr:DNA-directed RNA polymerase subunit beta' [bacterium]